MLSLSGIIPFTLIDFPGLSAAVLFCQGCSWRCGYCHNAHLQPFSGGLLSWDYVKSFLEERIGLLEGVVFSGGEPTQQKHLASAIRHVKDMGYKIGLHTAGVYPEGLEKVVSLVDWVGMDIKAPFDKYETITQSPGSGMKALASLEVILASGTAYEFRTTVDPDLLSHQDLQDMVQVLVAKGVSSYVIQLLRDKGQLVEKALAYYSPAFLEKLGKPFTHFLVR